MIFLNFLIKTCLHDYNKKKKTKLAAKENMFLSKEKKKYMNKKKKIFKIYALKSNNKFLFL
jgi:hypothetical protein